MERNNLNQKELRRQRTAIRRLAETPEEREERLSDERERKRNRKSEETPDERERNLSYFRNRRNALTPQQREQSLSDERERIRNLRARQRDQNRIQQHQVAQNVQETEIQQQHQVAQNNQETEIQQQHQFAQNDQETEIQQQHQVAQNNQETEIPNEDGYDIALRHRKDEIFRAERNIIQHYCGKMEVQCIYCTALHFRTEVSKSGSYLRCCQHGKFKLSDIDVCPDFLKEMLTNCHDIYYKNFRDNIRSFNSALSFASFGAKVDRMPHGPQVFKIQGQIYHSTNHLQTLPGQAPKYDQLYIVDHSEASEHRVNFNAGCNREIMEKLDMYIRNNNRYAQSLKFLKEVQEEQDLIAQNEGIEPPNVNLTFIRDLRDDQRRYNLPVVNEVAVVFMNNDGEPPFNRDFRVYARIPESNQNLNVNAVRNHAINEVSNSGRLPPPERYDKVPLNVLSGYLEAWCYVLFNLSGGQFGWTPNWAAEPYPGVQSNSRRANVTKLQYVSAMLHDRPNQFQPRLHAGKLTQQYIVDQYTQIEAQRLCYLRQNQKNLRAENYQGLLDFIAGQAENMNARPGVIVVLPSSFEGSPRNLRERFCDASAIFQKVGPPDLFITMTANPNWEEIKENLIKGETATDRPDLVVRVFEQKLESLMDDIIGGMFGTSKAWVLVIEFQKRGLPHAHILVTLDSAFKFLTPERVDKVISAEIPDVNSNPLLHSIVVKQMMHGPCGSDNPQNVCMIDGTCSKDFPKNFQAKTIIHSNGYPVYRRSQGSSATVRGRILDNRYVVPYNPELLLKYNCHINVEATSSVRAVKYIYKYIYKGYDCARLAVHSSEVSINEIDNFINARYVGATDAMWRIFRNEMHKRSHAVIRMPVHLENMQTVVFQEGNEASAIPKTTMLLDWFKLNERDANANQYLYIEIPLHYVWHETTRKWQPRVRGSHKVVPRIFLVDVKNVELFCLRTLLFYVRGAKCYNDLKTVDGILHDSFKAAAVALNLISSDEEWQRCLTEAQSFQLPRQLRETFAYICVLNTPSQPLLLWENFKISMSEDYLRCNNNEDEAFNCALHDLEFIFRQHATTCATFGLPAPFGDPLQTEQGIVFNPVVEGQFLRSQLPMLNNEQRHAYNLIMNAVNDENERDRYFFIDGPGGSGKTFLYSTILAAVRSLGHIALPFATTGIAALLLKGGRTVHSGFKLPIPLHETSKSSMRPNSRDAQQLRDAKLILLDEISMLTKDGLRCIDLLLRDITQSEEPFGNKTIVVGGDFRQTLPVLTNGSRTDIIESTVKKGSLWHLFKKITLSQNMRSFGQREHNEWLLKIGNGSQEEVVAGFPRSTILMENDIVTDQNLIDVIYGNIQHLSDDDLAARAILTCTNAEALEINRQVINKIEVSNNNQDARTYYSADKIVSEDVNDFNNYPLDFLHQLTPSGLPPHILKLKKGVIVMLIRNLNPRKGLCNGTRLKITGFGQYVIEATILSEINKGTKVLLPRITLTPSDTRLPFVLKRTQFPVIPAFAMTINKSQGQTLEHVGVHLTNPVFSHGQLYVALSRCRLRQNLKIHICETSLQGPILKGVNPSNNNIYTQNIVYKEIFQN